MSFTPRFYNLRELVHLDLSYNKITLLRDFSLPNLRSLDVTSNKIRYVSSDANIPQLKDIYLDKNPIREIWGVRNEQIVSAPRRKNQISFIPERKQITSEPVKKVEINPSIRRSSIFFIGISSIIMGLYLVIIIISEV